MFDHPTVPNKKRWRTDEACSAELRQVYESRVYIIIHWAYQTHTRLNLIPMQNCRMLASTEFLWASFVFDATNGALQFRGFRQPLGFDRWASTEAEASDYPTTPVLDKANSCEIVNSVRASPVGRPVCPVYFWLACHAPKGY